MLILLILIFFLLLIFLLSLPIYITIEYRRKDEDSNFVLNIFIAVSLMGIKIRIPYFGNKVLVYFTGLFKKIDILLNKLWLRHKDVDFEKEITLKKIQIKKIKKTLRLLANYKLTRIITRELKIKCRKLYWSTEFGLTNPAYTGIANGFIWIFTGLLLKYLNRVAEYEKKPEIEILPDFDNKKFDTYFNGIFSIILGNIIITVIKVLLYKAKGGSSLWENIQLKN